MTLGNVGALVQDNIKRLLAYSSIAHAGYVLVAFAAQPELGTSAVMFYTAAYAAMNRGAHLPWSVTSPTRARRYLTLEDYAGLGRRSPIPRRYPHFFPDVTDWNSNYRRFFGKFYIFSAALKANLVGLTVIGLINSAVGAYYYLRVIVMMYMREPRGEVPVTPVLLRHWVGYRCMCAGVHSISEFCRDVCSITLPSLLVNWSERPFPAP